MKAILEFDLPEEEGAFQRAERVGDVFCAIAEFGEYLRGQEKHTEPGDRDDLVAIRAEWFRCFADLLDL